MARRLAALGVVAHSDGWRLGATPVVVDPRAPASVAFFTHAHTDHIAPVDVLFATSTTCEVAGLRTRIGRALAGAPGDRLELEDGTLTLHPAGHCPGAAMGLWTTPAGTVLLTGDLGRSGMLGCPDPTPVGCTALVVDATSGAPDHRYPPMAEAGSRLVERVAATLARGAVPVVFGHSFGRAHEAVLWLDRAGIPTALSPGLYRYVPALRHHGLTLRHATRLSGRPRRGVAVIYPDRARHGATRPFRDAWRIALSGMRGAGAAATLGVDEVIPLVDHADFDALLAFVEACSPEVVISRFAQQDVFAEALRTRGWTAVSERALGEAGWGGGA